VAFSGGLDSTVAAKAAQLALGNKAVAVTGVSESLAAGELDEAKDLARLIGIRHELIQTGEMANPDYRKNDSERCFFCKTELFTQVRDLAERFQVAVVVDGSNRDDLREHRPGRVAAAQQKVKSPLADCGLDKAEIRQLAAHWEIPAWNKPATPCLSSRIAYGEQVTPERLAMVDQAEQFLRRHDLGSLRVRYHKGDLARLEVPLETLPRICEPEFRRALVAHLKSLGFKYVAVDLEGFRSGSMNDVLPVESLRIVAKEGRAGT
jgi:pyridinium-3,5-biscarboxylic acid mononucleotide sulfurtransferase